MKARPIRLIAASAVVGIGIFGAVGLASAQSEDVADETTEEIVELESDNSESDNSKSDSGESDDRHGHRNRDGHCEDKESSDGEATSSSADSTGSDEEVIASSSL